MNRFDRALGILLLLRGGKEVSALDLARRLEVSTRTIYRDMETLSTLGVPIYAERGRTGGFRLLEGYFLPPIMFSKEEAVSLVLSVTLLRSLRSKPSPADLETAEKKLLAAIPADLRAILAEAQKVIGFEEIPVDTFHPEQAVLSTHSVSSTLEPTGLEESKTITTFLQAVLDHRTVSLHYRSPYKATMEDLLVEPFGVFWDRDHWYLVGKLAGEDTEALLWRAERVLQITTRGQVTVVHPNFDIRQWLGRNWLKGAMKQWSQESPVKIRLSRQQAQRLEKDWYYRHATFEQISEDRVLMIFGEDNRDIVLSLLRWLGPGAELIEPVAWRPVVKAELIQMLADYA